MKHRRLLAGGVCVVSVIICLLSIVQMTERVRGFNAQAHFRFYSFTPINVRSFTAFGRPVMVADEPPVAGSSGEPAAAADDAQATSTTTDEVAGGWHVRLSYGEESVLIPVKRPPVENAPELAIYDEWFAVVQFVQMVTRGEGQDTTLVPKARTEDGASTDEPIGEQVDDSDGEVGEERGGGGERVVAMTRVPPPGYDPATWGAVKRADWSFRFYELKRDGTIEETLRRWPRSDRSERTLARTARGERGTAAEQAVAKMLAAIPPLEERSLEYQLALNVIPKLNVPSYKFKKTAMEAMGWTLPTAFFSMVVVIVSGAAAAAPKVKSQTI